MLNRCSLIRVLAYSVVVATAMSATLAEEKDSVDRDYSKELPRIKPTQPADALKTFTVAPGFRIEQVAAEPLVTDPIAMAFDEDGRLFVVEMRGYSEDDDKNLGQIRLLVDTDEDGKFDKSTIYADGLSWPTAITCYGGGVFVGAAPNIFYFKDTDGDGEADKKEHVFAGFGRSNVQGLLNTFKWGMDNRIHGATSSSGANVTRVAKGGDALTLRGRDFAFNPKTLDVFATSGGGQHGLSFDTWGNKFVCSNSNHIQFVMFEDRYVARNPYLAPPSPRVMIATDGPQADVFRTSPVEPWRIVRTRLRVQGIVPGPVEGGGTAAGYFTGATGITIYRGNAWPEKFRDWAIIGDVGSNLVHRKRLETNGVAFRGHRVDEKTEFISSSDIWFRPAQFANAPDGALYIADMYREVIEHPKSLHPVIKKHLDLTSGRDRGRIYRIVPDDFKQPALPKLGDADTATLVSTLDHANGWHRETAARLLYQRQDRHAVALLEKLCAEARLPEGRVWALYALDGQQALSPDVVLLRLSDEHPRVREHAVRLSERVAADSPAVRDKLFSMTADADLRVRYQLAFTLGELSGPQRNAALASLLRRDSADGAIRLAVRSSLAEGCGAVLAVLLADKPFRQSKTGQAVVRELASQIGRQQSSDDVAALLKSLASLPADERAATQAVVQGLAAKPGSSLQKQVAEATGGRAAELMKTLIAAASQRAVDESLPVEQRAAAIHQLQLGNFDELRATLNGLIAPAEPVDVQSAAIDTLAKFDAPGVAELLVDRWPGFTPRLRRQAEEVLFSRGVWIEVLLASVVTDKVKLADLQRDRLRLLASHSDAGIRKSAQSLLANFSADPGRSKIVEQYQSVLKTPGNAERGKAAFKKVCAACHKVGDVGYEIGPNLAAMRNRGPESILLNVLDPSREVNPQYLSYSVQTHDGRTLTGMISAETATSVTLRRADNKSDTVLRIDIDQMRSSGKSLMPDGLEKEIDKQGLADVIEYLRSLD